MELIPYKSTHLQVTSNHIVDCTVGKYYRIESWGNNSYFKPNYTFYDDVGDLRNFIYSKEDLDIKDASFVVNLNSILEE